MGRLSSGPAGHRGRDDHPSHGPSAPQVSRLTWFTRHDPAVHKEQVPPPTVLPPKGPAETGSRDLPLEALPGSEAGPHGECPLRAPRSGRGFLLKGLALQWLPAAALAEVSQKSPISIFS